MYHSFSFAAAATAQRFSHIADSFHCQSPATPRRSIGELSLLRFRYWARQRLLAPLFSPAPFRCASALRAPFDFRVACLRVVPLRCQPLHAILPCLSLEIDDSCQAASFCRPRRPLSRASRPHTGQMVSFEVNIYI